MHRILVVDDDQNILNVIKMRMELENFQVATATNADIAITKARNELFDLALVDLKLNGLSGLDLMDDLHEIDPELPIIILTGHGTIKSAVEAMKKGAFTYLTKPFDSHELLHQIQNCIERRNLSKEVKRLKKIVNDNFGFENIIGKSEAMKKVMLQVAQAADSNSTVYIRGESGTGKELIAKSLHLASTRRNGPFVAINCAAIPETLLESELFGFKKGAFTGADKSKTGLLAQANGGTFLFDEVSEMSPNMQAKLLRALEEKEILPLGGNKPIPLDARIVVASNKDVGKEVEKGAFREDLYYRIHVIVIDLPPLRVRKEDIPLLAMHFLLKYSKQMEKKIMGFTPRASQKLLRHSWPGNVRELENAIEAAVALASKNIISEDLILQTQQISNKELKSLRDAKRDFERNYLIQLIQFTQGNVTQAAKLAGKYRADLYELLKKYDLNPADYRKDTDNG